ncbi:MAG: BON domain-containing protein [Polyangiales bacterium]
METEAELRTTPDWQHVAIDRSFEWKVDVTATMKTIDTDPYGQLLAQIGAESQLDGAEIGIAVDDGVATLFGRVENHEQKHLAERAALRSPGIFAVAIELAEEDRSSHRRTDTQVARKVADYLRDRQAGGMEAVRAGVEKGRVTLNGEVDLFHQKADLERDIRQLPGVSGIVNLVSVRPPESQADIHAKVQSAVIRELASLDPEASTGRRSGERKPTMIPGRKILIIDDDDDFRASVKPVLEAAGYLVVEATSGHEGLAQLVTHNPDAIVLDIMMETNEEGYGVNQAIKYQDQYKSYRSTPILMVSSIQETPDDRYPRAPEVEMIQPDAYFTKPLDIDRFLEVVKRAVARRRHA